MVTELHPAWRCISLWCFLRKTWSLSQLLQFTEEEVCNVLVATGWAFLQLHLPDVKDLTDGHSERVYSSVHISLKTNAFSLYFRRFSALVEGHFQVLHLVYFFVFLYFFFLVERKTERWALYCIWRGFMLCNSRSHVCFPAVTGGNERTKQVWRRQYSHALTIALSLLAAL